MSTDFDHLLASLATDADRVRLAAADQLRSAGDARTRRHFIATASTLVVVVAILVGAGIAFAGNRPLSAPPMPIGPPPSVSALPPSSPPLSSPPPSSPPPSSPPPSSSAAAGAPCTASSLVYDNQQTGGAMGSVYYTFTFHNAGPLSCTVQGSPELTYVDTGGTARKIPTEHGPAGSAVLVAPGAAVQLVTHEINGYGGYQPGAPECAHPATYRQVAVMLPDGPVSLRSDGTMSVQCGSITVESWNRPGQ